MSTISKLFPGIGLAIRDIQTALETHLEAENASTMTIIKMLGALLVTWWIYVPIHELFHVAGCLLGGGSVSELFIAPQYGGTLLARIFPFVVSGGEYAGRLTGFDTRGSDFIYLLTDFFPYTLTLLFGVLTLRWSLRRQSPAIFGMSLVFVGAPFISVTGDYYEMGSIIITRFVSWIFPSFPWALYRSDDTFRLIGEIMGAPLTYGITGTASVIGAVLLILLSLIVSVWLIGLTHLGSTYIANLIERLNTYVKKETTSGEARRAG